VGGRDPHLIQCGLGPQESPLQTGPQPFLHSAAARLVTGTRRHDHIKPATTVVDYWLPVRRRIEFKVTRLVHQLLSGQASGYLADDGRLVSETSRRALQSTTVMTADTNQLRRQEFCRRRLPARACGTTCHRLCDVNLAMNCGRHFYSGTESTALGDSSICSAL